MARNEWVTSFRAIEGYLESDSSGELLLEQGHSRAESLAAHARRCKRVRVAEVSRSKLRSRTGIRNARIAAFRSTGSEKSSGTQRFELSSLFDAAPENVVVALDQITDPHNVGAIIRSADRFGARAVIYPARGAPSIGETVMQASAGTAGHIDHGPVVNLARSLRSLAQAGYWVYGSDASGRDIRTAVINFPAVIVLGSEGKGMRPAVRSACDELLSIPGKGFADSLNVSVAAGVVLYEFFRRVS